MTSLIRDQRSTIDVPLAFQRRFIVGWGSIDANDHMRNTAYFDAAADVRLAFLESRGWTRERFDELHLGPIAFDERIRYRREIRLREAFDVTLELAGISADGARLRLRSRFLDGNERELAELTSELGWMDLVARRLAPVPGALADAFLELKPTPDFTELTARRIGVAKPALLRVVGPER